MQQNNILSYWENNSGSKSNHISCLEFAMRVISAEYFAFRILIYKFDEIVIR